jgi:DNA-3-methyladenine glycosylase I
MPDVRQRCSWARSDKEIRYHDMEWGVPRHDDRVLFEFLLLEGAQAGLSWSTILDKREHYRQVFDEFDPARIAVYTERKINTLLQDAGIVRNRLKIEAAVKNARCFLDVQREWDTFGRYIWQFSGGRPIQNLYRSAAAVPATTAASERMSRDLLKRGFKFVGPTICYAFMQAVGMVNDHLVSCFRHAEVAQIGT